MTNNKHLLKRLSKSISKLEKVCSELEMITRYFEEHALSEEDEISILVLSKFKSIDFFIDRINKSFSQTGFSEAFNAHAKNVACSTNDEFENEAEEDPSFNPVIDHLAKIISEVNERANGHKLKKYDKIVSMINESTDPANDHLLYKPFTIDQNTIDLVRSKNIKTGQELYMHILLGGDTRMYIAPSAREILKDKREKAEQAIIASSFIKGITLGHIFDGIGDNWSPEERIQEDNKVEIKAEEILKQSEETGWSPDLVLDCYRNYRINPQSEETNA